MNAEVGKDGMSGVVRWWTGGHKYLAWLALVQGVDRHEGFTDLVAGIAITEVQYSPAGGSKWQEA